MGVQVGVVGGSGYAGGELLRLLSASPALALRTVAGRASAGRPLAEVFPHLGHLGHLGGLVEPAEAGVFDDCELVFLATPHEASLELAPPLVGAGIRVVDLSAAYRLDPGTFAAAYGQAHPSPELTPAAYGLPELFRGDLAGAALVANPGCYPTAALLALAPLVSMVAPGSVHITGLSGTSGAGKGLRDDLHASHAAGNVAVYATPGHRHTPEIEAAWERLTGTQATVTFTPHLLPLARGMLVTVTADLLAEANAEGVTEQFAQAYAHEPFVRLVAPGSWPQTAYTRGANTAVIGVAVDPRTGRVTIACALDNLVKGAAGQAIQNANLLCGLPETTGLPVAGVYP